MNTAQQLTEHIKRNEPFVFAKYGDGEAAVVKQEQGGNCDGTPYTENLGRKVKESIYVYGGKPNIYITTMDKGLEDFWEGILGYKPKWAIYQSINIEDFNTPDKAILYKAIQDSKRKKIYIGNFFMMKTVMLLNIDVFIPVDPKNWFESSYDFILQQVGRHIVNDADTMIITSAGMGAKPLIADLYKQYPNAMYIDAGSAFDLLCTRRASRAYHPSYEILCAYLKDIIPEGWDDAKWNILYILAKQNLG